MDPGKGEGGGTGDTCSTFIQDRDTVISQLNTLKYSPHNRIYIDIKMCIYYSTVQSHCKELTYVTCLVQLLSQDDIIIA